MNKRNILEYLEESARLFPEKHAFIGEGCALSFSELHYRARAIGSFIASKGYYRRPIVLMMGREPDTVAAILGVMAAGCFYVCVDKDVPDSRKLAMLERTRAALLIVRKGELEAAKIFSGRAEIIVYENALLHRIDECALSEISERRTDTDLAYITFTSGSTGEPKGVSTSHRALIDYADALCASIPFSSSTVFGNQAPLYYDAPMKEILPCLVLGASTVFIPSELFLFPTSLLEFIRDNGINTLCWAASAFAAVSTLGALDGADLTHLRLICHGSESFPRGEYDKWRRACPNAIFVNLYGPTEATGMSAYWIAERELEPDEPIPIGRAFPNTEIFLIDEKGNESDSGEIYIRGSCLSSGYFNDFEANERAFVPDPRNKSYRDTVYRTGDAGMINDRGELVCLGRLDRQIKIMGRRIEPREIEFTAERYPSVSVARCVFDKEKQMIILGYVGECEERVLMSHLRNELARYMLPKRICRLASIPRLQNGKTDHRELEKILIGEKSDGEANENFR